MGWIFAAQKGLVVNNYGLMKVWACLAPLRMQGVGLGSIQEWSGLLRGGGGRLGVRSILHSLGGNWVEINRD